jgi:3D (Asp-Asp-Asp) domain-containing protein
MKSRMTDEERVAVRISALISDLRLDIEKVGVYMARTGGNVVNNRLDLLTEVAQEERQGHDIRANHYTLF